MTSFERSQPASVFKHAGSTAFLIGIPVQNNPYKEKPFRDLWDKGFRAAKREFENKRTLERMEREGLPAEKKPLNFPSERPHGRWPTTRTKRPRQQHD